MNRMTASAFSVLLIAAGAQAQELPSYPLGDGVVVALGNGWETKTMTNPAMKMPGVRDLLEDAQELRFRTEGTGILVSAMKFKPRDGETLDNYDGPGIAREVLSQYLNQSVESEVTVDSRINGSVEVSLGTLNAREGQSFLVSSGYPGGCVSGGNVRKGWLVMAVSIASESCESGSHKAALEAVLKAHDPSES